MKRKSFPCAAARSAIKTRAEGLVPEVQGDKLLSLRTELLAWTQLAFSALGPVVRKEHLVLAFEMTLS